MTPVGRPICRRSVTVFNLTFLSRHIIVDTLALQWWADDQACWAEQERGVTYGRPPGGPSADAGHSFADRAWKTLLNDATESDDGMMERAPGTPDSTDHSDDSP